MMSITCSQNQSFILDKSDLRFTPDKLYSINYFKSKNDKEKLMLLLSAVLSKNFIKIDDTVLNEILNK